MDKQLKQHEARLKGLRESRDAAQKTIKDIQAAGELAGTQLRVGMKAAWETMQRAMETAAWRSRK